MDNLTAKRYMVQLRGLPYRVSAEEVADWLSEAADPISVNILMEGGSAKVAKRVAKTMHMKDIGERYIECFYGVGLQSSQGPTLTPWPNQTETYSSSILLQDCYFHQFMECGRKAKCPFLHRTIPEEVCNRFLFKLCNRNLKCPRQHLSASSLPAPSVQEQARVRSVRKDRKQVSHYVYKKGKARERSEGSVVMSRAVNESESSRKVPEVTAFECLDCEVASTSCFLLENHLNSGEHWNRIQQIKMDNKEMKGVVGDRVDIWSSQDERDWIAARNEKKTQHNNIHVCNIPLDMTMKTFRQICLQYGEVSKLKMLPMSEVDAQHAYVRYPIEEDKEFASKKLKKLQKCHFAGISELLPENVGQDDTNKSDDDNATNVKREEMYEDLLNQKTSKISDQLLQLTSAREDEETKLLLCRTQKKIYQLNGAGPEDTLKLVEEELKIQRDLRDLECAVQQAEEELDNLKNCKSSGFRSLDSSSCLNLKAESSPGNNCDFKIRQGEDCSGRTFFLPGDVFNSDDEDDVDVIKEEMSESQLSIQNIMLPQLSKEKQEKNENFKDLFVSLPSENKTWYSDDLIGQSKTVCEEDVIESTKPIVRNRNINK